MRLAFLLTAAALALGLAFAAPANAHQHHRHHSSQARVWVSLGDVVFSAGMPYHRQYRQPLFTQPGRHGPRYYYWGPHAAHHGAGHGYAPAYYYDHNYYTPAPPPPRRRGYNRHRRGY